MTAAIQELTKKRQELISERDRLIDQFHKQIMEIETAIETLTGKKVWEVVSEELFDDLNPNYIKQSFEEY